MSTEPITFFARTIRGIEWIAAAEIERRCGAAITDVQHREIRFTLDSLEASLLKLGSVDDVFLTCGTLSNIDHTRAALAYLANSANSINFQRSTSLLRQIRDISKSPNFDVIASFLGRRNYNRFEIEDTIAEAIRQQTGWTYTPQREDKSDRLDLSFRIHLSNNDGIIGARLANVPLHRRAYKEESRTGTLHPPLAFAMAMLSGLGTNQRILDPCCGVGTILIESLELEPKISACGIDIDGESITKAATIAARARKDIQFLIGDAGSLPFAEKEMDRIISNPPWGRAVGFRGDAGKTFFDEIARVTKSDARIVLLMDGFKHELDRVKQHGFKILLRTAVSLFGSWPEILVLGRESQDPEFIAHTAIFGPTLAKYWQMWPTLFQKTGKQS